MMKQLNRKFTICKRSWLTIPTTPITTIYTIANGIAFKNITNPSFISDPNCIVGSCSNLPSRNSFTIRTVYPKSANHPKMGKSIHNAFSIPLSLLNGYLNAFPNSNDSIIAPTHTLIFRLFIAFTCFFPQDTQMQGTGQMVL